jgi:hypothetical protein
MGTRSLVSTSDQFRLSNLQSRFQSMSGLWERQLRDLEEGRTPGRPQAAPSAGPGAGPVSEDHLDRAVDGWKTARTECGLPAGDAEAAAFREMLRRKATEIAGTGGGRVEFSVSVEAGKPKIRAAVRKDD